MIFDSHIHSIASTDSKTKPEAAIALAKKKGLGITFTEHYDADYVGNNYDFRVDSAQYLKEYGKFKEPGVLLGIEIGLTHMSIGVNKRIASSHPFDYVIGSVHMVGDIDIYLDLNKSGLPRITGETYFDYVLEMIVNNDFFDSLGHIDYPHRYVKNLPVDYTFKTHRKKYEAIFKSLIERDMPIEVNSKRLSDRSAYNEMYEIYKRYHELGGRYVTLGSDSHYLEEIGRNFDSSMRLVKDIGLIPVYFMERKRYEIKP